MYKYRTSSLETIDGVRTIKSCYKHVDNEYRIFTISSVLGLVRTDMHTRLPSRKYTERLPSRSLIDCGIRLHSEHAGTIYVMR